LHDLRDSATMFAEKKKLRDADAQAALREANVDDQLRQD